MEYMESQMQSRYDAYDDMTREQEAELEKDVAVEICMLLGVDPYAPSKGQFGGSPLWEDRVKDARAVIKITRKHDKLYPHG